MQILPQLHFSSSRFKQINEEHVYSLSLIKYLYVLKCLNTWYVSFGNWLTRVRINYYYTYYISYSPNLTTSNPVLHDTSFEHFINSCNVIAHYLPVIDPSSSFSKAEETVFCLACVLEGTIVTRWSRNKECDGGSCCCCGIKKDCICWFVEE